MTDNEKHIPAGYKSSPLGIIPEDWEVKRLGKIANRIGDGIHGTPKYTDKSEYYFINGNNLNNGKIVINDSTKCVPYSEYIKYKKNIPQHTILLSINGTIGNIALYNDEKVMLGKSAAYITIPNYKFFYHLLQSNRVLTAFEKELTGTTIRNLSLDSIRNLTIALPSQKEIESISTLLDLWDTAISKQTALTEKLTIRKRGLMQQLLTGKKRLKGFEGEWKEVKLGEIAERITRKNEEDNQNVVTISAQRGFVVQTEFFNKSIASETLDNYFLVYKDEFCYNKSYSNGYPMGVIKRMKTFDKAVVTTLYICFALKRETIINIDFFEQYGDSGILNKELIKVANEGGRAHGLLNVTSSDFFNMHMRIPSIDEQNAIASVLVNADKEIEIQKQKLMSLQELKKGLMQVLLTGERRVRL
ncbi:MAG: restriction endonuclease subunit S [Paludibacteraceae bacterium]|nr:restriction endonuclease subunit S [Paludibacteraceae bacterium]